MRLKYALLTMSLLLSAWSVAAQDPEEAAIRAVVERYFQGLATGDGSHYRVAFLPEARIYQALRDGTLTMRTGEEFAAAARGKPSDTEWQNKRRILSLDRTGTAAMVKTELSYPKLVFIDYLSLVKVGGEWRIISKVFDAVRPNP